MKKNRINATVKKILELKSEYEKAKAIYANANKFNKQVAREYCIKASESYYSFCEALKITGVLYEIPEISKALED